MAILRGWECDWRNYKSEKFHPVQLIIQNWIQNIHDLIYLPVCCELKAQAFPEFELETGRRKEPSQAELFAFADPKDSEKIFPLKPEERRNQLNYFRAIKNLYHEFGWPDQTQFNRAEFLSAVSDFYEKVRDYDVRLRKSNRKAFWLVHGVVFTPKEMEMRKEKDDYLQQMAGPLAIKRSEDTL
jgi:hypothetical protein